jgi:hypothetical protein
MFSIFLIINQPQTGAKTQMPSRSFTTDVFVSNWTDIITIFLQNYKNISFKERKSKKSDFSSPHTRPNISSDTHRSAIRHFSPVSILNCLSTARNTNNKNFASKFLINWAL